MLQIAIWLGCFYLVLKGWQMLQAALVVDATVAVKIIGYVGLAASVVGAFVFIGMADKQANGQPPLSLGQSATSSPAMSQAMADALDNAGANLMDIQLPTENK